MNALRTLARLDATMETVIVVLAGLAALFAGVTAFAFYRGWFRLTSIAHEEKVQFILMQKKQPLVEQAKVASIPAGNLENPFPIDPMSPDADSNPRLQ